MKQLLSIRGLLAGFAAGTLMVAGFVAPANAATALQGQILLRPVTPGDISTYGLPASTEVSGGLTAVGVGQPAYFEADVNLAIPAADITSVIWSLTSQPVGSAATLQPSPLGTNVPVYEPADRLVSQVAGRILLRPDIAGQYTVSVTIVTASEGTTNLTLTMSAGTYMGVNTCALCHSGGLGAPDMVHPWETTLHSTMFARGVDGILGSFYSKSCLQCHTVGYDTNTNAVNGGFDDIWKTNGWVFPTNLVPGNWAGIQTNYPSMANVANIQCENCHGPGSAHAYSLGQTNLIGLTWSSGACNQCHDAPTHHIKGTEWYSSLHAKTTRSPSGSPSRIACVRCHTAHGFADYVDNLGSATPYATNTDYTALTCQACHDPHDATNPYQLRTSTTVTFNGNTGFTVTNAGLGGFCMNCHNSRNGSVSNSIVQYPLSQVTWNGGSGFGPHDGPQGDMLEGVNGWTYGQVIPSSPHANVVSNTCVGCHMQTIASTDPAFLKAGGHTWEMSYTNNLGAKVPVTYVCTQCHGTLTNFDFAVNDYNGDGVIEGVQTEVQHLLDKLSTLLPPAGYQANANNYIPDGKVKAIAYNWSQTNMPAKYLEAAYNWQFVNNDGSHGVHNLAYAVGLLKASIGNLTGDANGDGIPDAWQIQYFGAGFATNSLAAPNAINNTAGIPNWMMCALNLDPRSAFTVGGSGEVYFNGNNIVNGSASGVTIYTAAEIAFNTQVGKTYQIQGISSFTGGWQNISTNIPGTGGSISYLTPTRNNAQMFFRVLSQ